MIDPEFGDHSNERVRVQELVLRHCHPVAPDAVQAVQLAQMAFEQRQVDAVPEQRRVKDPRRRTGHVAARRARGGPPGGDTNQRAPEYGSNAYTESRTVAVGGHRTWL